MAKWRGLWAVTGFTLASGAALRIASAQGELVVTSKQASDAVAMSDPIPANATVQPTWASLTANYAVPDWLHDGKFGIMMHWGVYSAAAYHNEWDEMYMYGGNSGIADWYTTNFGPRKNFGYLDFLDPNKTTANGLGTVTISSTYTYKPFTASAWDPNAWASLFAQSGAKLVTITAQHHDGFALWDSSVTPYNTVNFGPHRDIVGDLATAVRANGMKFGVQNHEIENYEFLSQLGTTNLNKLNSTYNDYTGTITAANGTIYPRLNFYRPDQISYAGQSNTDPLTHFLDDWYERNVELINKYQPDMIWFDNGLNDRSIDPLKTKMTAYYYNKALTWNKQVTVTAKKTAYLGGSLLDYESTSPTSIQTTPFQREIKIATTWGYSYTQTLSTSATGAVRTLTHLTSLNGVMLLNLDPQADGTILTDQKNVLTTVGSWLSVNGDAIYGTDPWWMTMKYYEGSSSSGASSSADFRFTTKNNDLYAIMMGWPSSGTTATIQSLGTGDLPGTTITSVQLLGYGTVAMSRSATALTITLPTSSSKVQGPGIAYAFKISGSGLVPEPATLGMLGVGALALLRRRRPQAGRRGVRAPD